MPVESVKIVIVVALLQKERACFCAGPITLSLYMVLYLSEQICVNELEKKRKGIRQEKGQNRKGMDNELKRENGK